MPDGVPLLPDHEGDLGGSGAVISTSSWFERRGDGIGGVLVPINVESTPHEVLLVSQAKSHAEGVVAGCDMASG